MDTYHKFMMAVVGTRLGHEVKGLLSFICNISFS